MRILVVGQSFGGTAIVLTAEDDHRGAARLAEALAGASLDMYCRIPGAAMAVAHSNSPSLGGGNSIPCVPQTPEHPQHAAAQSSNISRSA